VEEVESEVNADKDEEEEEEEEEKSKGAAQALKVKLSLVVSESSWMYVMPNLFRVACEKSGWFLGENIEPKVTLKVSHIFKRLHSIKCRKQQTVNDQLKSQRIYINRIITVLNAFKCHC